MISLLLQGLRTGLLGGAAVLTLGAAAGLAAEPQPVEPGAAEPEAERKLLLGDMGGLRPALPSVGIELGLDYIGEAFGSAHGGVKRGAVYEGLASASVDADLGKLFAWPGAKAHAKALQIHGRGPSDRLLGGNLMTVSNIEALPTTRLYTLWLEQSLFDGALSIRAGQLGADDEFVVSDTAGGLINGTFGWPLLTSADMRGGGPAYPLPQPGIRVQVKPASDVTLRGAAFSANPGGRGCTGDPQACDRHGVKFAFSGGALWLAEVEYAANAGKDATGLPGVYKLGGWRETGAFPDQFTGALDRRGNWGVYAVADQAVWRRPGSDDQGVNLFLRLGGAPSGRNLVAWYVDGGLGFKGPFAGRPDDVLTLGAAYGRISAEAARADRLAGAPTPVRDHEAVIEISYSLAVIPGWTMQPDLQYVIHPGGNAMRPTGRGTIPDALLLGLRTTITF